MLNRIRYILIALLLSACLAKPALAVNDSTISYVSINDKVYEDVELMITDGAQILVPFKQLADIFQIKYSANRVDKLILFTTHDGIDGEITNRGVFVDKQPIQKGVPIFLAQGIMDNVLNEAFITAEAAERIFGITLDTDYSTITINAQIDRDIPILHAFDRQLSNDKGPKANPGKLPKNWIPNGEPASMTRTWQTK